MKPDFYAYIIRKPAVNIMVFLFLFFTSSCRDAVSLKIRESLSRHYEDDARQNNKSVKSIVIDSITYRLADSALYYNNVLNLLSARSESFARMAKLRTSLAQAHLNNFLSGEKKENLLQEKIKMDVDKSLEDLKQNEREWNSINDSMDLMLNAVHTTDTLKKVFYEVNFLLKEINADNKIIQKHKKAILNRDDFNVAFVE